MKKREKVYAGIVFVALLYFVGTPIACQSNSFDDRVKSNTERLKQENKRLGNN